MSEMFTPITDETELQDILSGARGRGDYKTIMQAFLNAKVRLAQIPLDTGLLADAGQPKKASTAKTGFENVKGSKTPPEGAADVKVIKKGEQVYLLNTAVPA
jgi:hypothetical protein